MSSESKIIIEEYPKGKRALEMQLVKLLIDDRSWKDYCTIGSALHSISYTAKSMTNESNDRKLYVTGK